MRYAHVNQHGRYRFHRRGLTESPISFSGLGVLGRMYVIMAYITDISMEAPRSSIVHRRISRRLVGNRLTRVARPRLAVSPDGKTLWYELNQNDGSSTLYEVPTSGYSANPASFAPEISVGGQPTTVDNLSWEGWLWNSKFIPLQPPIQYQG